MISRRNICVTNFFQSESTSSLHFNIVSPFPSLPPIFPPSASKNMGKSQMQLGKSTTFPRPSLFSFSVVRVQDGMERPSPVSAPVWNDRKFEALPNGENRIRTSCSPRPRARSSSPIHPNPPPPRRGGLCPPNFCHAAACSICLGARPGADRDLRRLKQPDAQDFCRLLTEPLAVRLVRGALRRLLCLLGNVNTNSASSTDATQSSRSASSSASNSSSAAAGGISLLHAFRSELRTRVCMPSSPRNRRRALCSAMLAACAAAAFKLRALARIHRRGAERERLLRAKAARRRPRECIKE